MTKMAFNIKKSCFVKSATKPSHFPDDIYPEYFFAGKSNAGKSSLLNKICNRKNLAITSKTPGRTQLINFFLINNSISFVDIPGYGYANTPKKIIASWEDMINAYLSTRKKIIWARKSDRIKNEIDYDNAKLKEIKELSEKVKRDKKSSNEKVAMFDKLNKFDKYDSLTYNMYHYIKSLGIKVEVIRNDNINSKE